MKKGIWFRLSKHHGLSTLLYLAYYVPFPGSMSHTKAGKEKYLFAILQIPILKHSIPEVNEGSLGN